MPRFVYYVSGHGFGHATRAIEVCRALTTRFGGIDLHIRTVAPEWLFERELPSDCRFDVTAVATDVGLVQRDGLSYLLDETLAELESQERGLPELERRERRFLVRVRPDLVLTDISPFPMQWAAREGIPGVAIGNFGWDVIYASFASRRPAFGRHAERFRRAYEDTGLLLKLPFALPMEGFSRVKEVPLVSRRPRTSRESLRAKLRIDERPMVFLSFGGFDLRGVALDRLRELRDYIFVLAPQNGADALREVENVRLLSPQGIDHPGLVAASDVVLGKPGYGLVSEVVVSQSRMAYTSRGRFPEYPVLARALRRTGQAVYCSRRDLATGDLGPSLTRALARPERSRRPMTADGGSVIADAVAELGVS